MTSQGKLTKKTWGTFSTTDHLAPNAFVAEVMMYDKLVIPTPAAWGPGNTEDWTRRGWDPKHQEKLLDILGDRAERVNWDVNLQRRWKTRLEESRRLASQALNVIADPAAGSRAVLTEDLPIDVTGIQAVTNYSSYPQFVEELGLRRIDTTHSQPRGRLPGGALTTVLGHEFLIPNDANLSHEELLTKAVELSSEENFRRDREAFWAWQSNFLDSEGFTDRTSIKNAVDEMHDLVHVNEETARNHHIRTGMQYAFLAGSVALELMGGPFALVGVGGAFVSVGQFLADRIPSRHDTVAPLPIALFLDTRKQFGWESIKTGVNTETF